MLIVMKKTLFCLSLAVFLSFLLMPVGVMSVAPPGDLPDPTFTNLDELFEILGTLVGWVMLFVIMVAVVMIIWAGFNFITASGDEAKTKKGKSMLTYALIGVIVVLGVRGLISLAAMVVGVDAGPWLPF